MNELAVYAGRVKSCSGNDWQNILRYPLNDGLYRPFKDKRIELNEP